MALLTLAATGTATGATQGKYESLTLLGVLLRIDNDSLLAIADGVNGNLAVFTGKSNIRVRVSRSGTSLSFNAQDDGEGTTVFTTVARASLTAGAFITVSFFRRTGDGTVVASEVIIRQAGTTLDSGTSTLVLGAPATGAGTGAFTIGGAQAFVLDAAYVYDRRITVSDHDTEPTTGSSGIVGMYPIAETSGSTTADAISGGTALTLTSATLGAGGNWDNSGGGGASICALRRRRAA